MERVDAGGGESRCLDKRLLERLGRRLERDMDELWLRHSNDEQWGRLGAGSA